MTIQAFLILAVLFTALGIGAMFISENNGWKGGCGGNCSRCRSHCADPSATLAKKEREKAQK